MRAEKTTLYLPHELHRALKEAAKREGRPQAALIRSALEEYLGKIERPSLRSLGMGEDDRLSARNSEDWLAGEWAGR
jgi:predicted DNA-binding protein